MTDPPRQRKRRKEARPAEIIEAGLQEFALHGISGARMEDVAQRAGVAKGTIYRYFEDKESLFLAAIRARLPLFDGTLEQFIDAFPGKSADLLRLLFARIYSTIENPEARVLMRILIAEGVRYPALTELYHREVISRARALLTRVVDRGVARGEFRPGPAASLPMIIVAPMLMGAIWKMNFDRHEPIPTDTFLQAHIDLVLHGLEKR